MSSRSDRLRAERSAVMNESWGIARRALEEGRDLSDDEQRLIDEQLRRADELEHEATKLDNSSWRSLVNRPGGQPMNDNELEEVIRGTGPVRLTRPREQRLLATGTTGAGGAVVPTTLNRSLYEYLEVLHPARGLAEVIVTSDGGPLDLPYVTAHGTAVAATEGSAIGGTDPAFETRRLSSYKYGQLVQASSELVTDSAVDLASYLGRSFALAINRITGPLLTAGSGVGEPEGYAFAALTAGTGGTGLAGAPSYADLVDILYSINSEYRKNAVWMLHDTAAASIRKIVDDVGQPIWTPSVSAETPDLLLGRPVHEDPFLEPLGLNSKSIAFGDFSAFKIRQVGGVDVQRSDDYAFANDVITWRAIERIDSVLMDQDAIKTFQGGSA